MKSFKFYNTLVGWLAFAISAIVYLLTIEPSGSYWDCGEFIATAFKLQVGHPPGAPLFMIIARFFTLFAGGNLELVAVMVNVMSALCSAFTILFLFWTITHLARKIFANNPEDLTSAQIFGVIGSGLVGALAYTFTDTFWFSAVESEVYAMSSLFTAVVFWAILKWEDDYGKTYANRWLIFISYLMGLSIGVHLLNLLAIPAIVFVYYFKTTSKVTWFGAFKALLASGIILGGILYVIIPGLAGIGAQFELLFVNSFGLPFNSGVITYLFLLVGGLIFGIHYTFKHKHVIANTIILCVSVIVLGYSSYAMVVIRAFANTPIDENDPENVFALINYLNREQYGDRPLVKGQYFSAPITNITPKYSYTKNKNTNKYDKFVISYKYEFDPNFETVFPRMYSMQKDHMDQYKQWANIKGRQVVSTNSRGEAETTVIPTFGENLKFFFTYQVGHMYMRYFLWNFVGRQNDIQSSNSLTGNFISGIPVIDQMVTGSTEIPDYLKGNKGNNKYYFLPLILGLIGLFYQAKKDPKNTVVVGLLFVLTGLAIVVYLNQTPNQPRERDYAYAGSFYAFTIWIGLAVLSIQEMLSKITNQRNAAIAATTLGLLGAPVILAAQNWDDHDRSERYMAEDFAYNYLVSTLPNSILITNGDNDTFPLWFQQEVKGVRTDVRIMNTSLLGTDWYIDQMKSKMYESNPLPISIPKEKYVQGVNDQIVVMDKLKEYHEGKEVMDFILDPDPSTKIPYGNEYISYIPTRKIKFAVNKANALKYGIVSPKDSSQIVDSIYIDIKKSDLTKSDLVVLDILSHYQWDRPLYIVSPGGDGDLGFTDYLEFNGFAYKLVPIKTPKDQTTLDAGRINTDTLYNNLMNKYRWQTINNPNIYVDQNMSRTVIQVLRIRDMFSRLAAELIKEGKLDKALKVQDRGMELVPISMYAPELMPYSMPTIIENYYKLGQTAKANKLAEELLKRNINNLSFFFKLDHRYSAGLSMEKQLGMQSLYFIAEVATKYNQKDLAKKYNDALKQFYPYFDAMQQDVEAESDLLQYEEQ